MTTFDSSEVPLLLAVLPLLDARAEPDALALLDALLAVLALLGSLGCAGFSVLVAVDPLLALVVPCV